MNNNGQPPRWQQLGFQNQNAMQDFRQNRRDARAQGQYIPSQAQNMGMRQDLNPQGMPPPPPAWQNRGFDSQQGMMDFRQARQDLRNQYIPPQMPVDPNMAPQVPMQSPMQPQMPQGQQMMPWRQRGFASGQDQRQFRQQRADLRKQYMANPQGLMSAPPKIQG